MTSAGAPAGSPDVAALLAVWRAHVDAALAQALVAQRTHAGAAAPATLSDAMGYALLAPGKRLRPLLVLAAADAVHAQQTGAAPAAWPAQHPVPLPAAVAHAAMPAAVAVEMIHAYSLIHDDLPALDDDDVRRGRPSLHKATTEAVALLAGDALLTDAFATLAGAPHHAADQVLLLARATGSAGMVGGQLDDIAAEGKQIDWEALAAIHARKTGALVQACCMLGGVACGADAATREVLATYGASLGLAFQIKDDLLDVQGDAHGDKGTGRDAKHDKATTVRLLGISEATGRAQAEADRAAACADQLRAPLLRALAQFSVNRAR